MSHTLESPAGGQEVSCTRVERDSAERFSRNNAHQVQLHTMRQSAPGNMGKVAPEKNTGIARFPPEQLAVQSPSSTKIRRPTPGIASNVAPCGRIRHWSYLEQTAPRQCGRSSKPRAGSHPCEVMPALGCMRSPQGVNERRAARQSCAKTAPTRPQDVPGMGWECGSVQSEQRLRSWPPRHLQLLWVGWAQQGASGRNGGHAAGRTSFHGRNSASTYTAPVGATVQCGARAPCCRQNGREVQPWILASQSGRISQQRPPPRRATFTACSLRARPRP